MPFEIAPSSILKTNGFFFYRQTVKLNSEAIIKRPGIQKRVREY